MCIGGQPRNPTTTPSYAPEDASDYFDLSMEDGDGNKTQISENRPDEEETDNVHLWRQQ